MSYLCTVPATKTKPSQARPISLSRFPGSDVQILDRQPVSVNKYIDAEFFQISASDNYFPEEEGRLYLFPVADGIYNLQLIIRLNRDALVQEYCRIHFFPEFFKFFDGDILADASPFRFDKTTEQQFPICSRVRLLLDELGSVRGLDPFIHSLQVTEIAVQLLRRAIEQVSFPFAACPVPACRFLANESEREKIFKARQILESTLDQPLTIRELSRKVAMNECYLKKGFKTLIGKSINEYYQELRISKARILLQQQDRTVSEVASLLGYSSISHFSTAFKKATGLKPCELLG